MEDIILALKEAIFRMEWDQNYIGRIYTKELQKAKLALQSIDHLPLQHEGRAKDANGNVVFYSYTVLEGKLVHYAFFKEGVCDVVHHYPESSHDYRKEACNE